MPKSKISLIKAREILDSRGVPTIEVELRTDFGVFLASVPSGISKGKYEALELRDGRDARASRVAGAPVLKKRYFGMGVKKAVKNVNEIIFPKLKGKDPTRQKEIDQLMIELDGTENKSRLGANAILGVSMAVCRAGAGAENLPLYQYIAKIYRDPSSVKLTEDGSLSIPKPCFNVIEGGAHAGNDLDFQEFMIVPKEKLFFRALQIASEIYHQLKEIIKEKYLDLGINVGQEGGFAPPLRAPEEALDLILEAAKNLGYRNKIKIILDVAASQFFFERKPQSRMNSLRGRYKMKIGDFESESLVNYYSQLVQKYPILGLEDPFAQDDWEGWPELKSKVKSQKSKVLIIGDDLLVTNPKRMKMAKEKDACNAMILKLNQIGTISEALEAAKLAKEINWKIIVSHRSGETNDDFISDLAVGIGADFIKAGAPARGERIAKYNRLLKIEEELK